MSGVEIAGLVLGAFPILLNRLDYYRDGFEPLEEWWNFRTHFIAFVDDVNHQMMRYHQNMIRLLDPIITDNDGLIALVQNANDPRWKDGSLVIAMRHRLASEYKRFFRIIERMEQVMASLKQLLQMKKNHVHWIESRGQKPWEWHLNRIRISFSKGKNKKVKKLGTHNQELQDILGFSERIIPLAEKRKLSPPVTRLEKLRQHACNLHNALGLHLKCSRRSCRSHQIHYSVCIEPREYDMNVFFILQGDDEHSKPLKREVNIKPPDDLTVSSSEMTTQISDVQQAKDFTAMQERFEDKGTTQKGLGLRGLFSKTSKKTPPVSTSANGDAYVRKEYGKRARFATATPTVTVSQDTQSPDASTSWEDKCYASGCIADLCSTLRDNGKDFSLGAIADEFDRKYTLYTPADSKPGVGPPDNARFVPLPQLLDAYNQANIDIARHHRFEMAANIASALLHIQMSPWLATKWSKHDFFFLADSEGLYTYHPYVFQTFPAKVKNTPTSPAPDVLHPNSSEDEIRASLFTTGVIILELIFGHNIESCSFRHNYYGANNRPNDQTDLSTARRWAQKVLGECGPEISDVVRRCLDCSFGPRPSFSDKRFKEAVYEGVIGPLANYLKTWQAVMP